RVCDRGLPPACAAAGRQRHHCCALRGNRKHARRDRGALLRNGGPGRAETMNYCADPFSYHRRVSREVCVGTVGVGGHNPIRVQSMLTCDTMDTEASIAQTIALSEAGCEFVRIPAATVIDAAKLQHVVRG